MNYIYLYQYCEAPSMICIPSSNGAQWRFSLAVGWVVYWTRRVANSISLDSQSDPPFLRWLCYMMLSSSPVGRSFLVVLPGCGELLEFPMPLPYHSHRIYLDLQSSTFTGSGSFSKSLYVDSQGFAFFVVRISLR